MERLKYIITIGVIAIVITAIASFAISQSNGVDAVTYSYIPSTQRIAILENEYAELEQRVTILEGRETTTTLPVTTTSQSTTTTEKVTTTTIPVTTTIPATTTTTQQVVIPSSRLSVKDYGAIGNGITDDTRAIQKALDTGAAIKSAIYFPAGTYKTTSYLYLKSNMHLEGAEGSILYGAGSGKILYAWNGGYNISVKNLTIKGNYTAGQDTSTDGIAFNGVTNSTFSGLTMYGLHYGIAIGSGATCKNIKIDSCSVTKCVEPLYMANVDSSSFSNLTLQADKFSTNQWHGIYICHDVNNSSFENIDISGGSGYCLQLWNDEGSNNYLTFNNISLDATNGRYPLVIGHDFNNISMKNIKMAGSSGSLVTWYGGNNVVIDGFTASGGSKLLSGSGTVTNCAMKNGTYSGTLGSMSGVTLTNITR